MKKTREGGDQFLKHVKLAIKANKKINPKQLGIHSVYGGLIAYMKYAMKMDGKEVIDGLETRVNAGVLKHRPVKGGYMVYLPEDYQSMADKGGAQKLINAIAAM